AVATEAPTQVAADLGALMLPGVLREVRRGDSPVFRGLQYAPLDELLKGGTAVFLHPGTTALGSRPARGGETERLDYRHRLMLYAQANARHPNFTGLWYDTAATSLFNA